MKAPQVSEGIWEAKVNDSTPTIYRGHDCIGVLYPKVEEECNGGGWKADSLPEARANCVMAAASKKMGEALDKGLDFMRRLLQCEPDEAVDLLTNHGEDCETILFEALVEAGYKEDTDA